jgi:hypothetical protein
LNGQRQYLSMTNSAGSFTATGVIPGPYVIEVRDGNYVQSFITTIDADNSYLDLKVKW